MAKYWTSLKIEQQTFKTNICFKPTLRTYLIHVVGIGGAGVTIALPANGWLEDNLTWPNLT